MRGNDKPSLIDLIFSDELMQVSNVEHHAPLGKSDHNVITFKFHCYLDYSKPKISYAYHRADFDAMRRNLVENKWEENYYVSESNKSCEDLWKSLKTKLLDLRETFVPKKQSTVKPSWKKSGGIPINKNLQEAIRYKHKTHRRWMSATGPRNKEEARLIYTKARRKVKTLMRQAKIKFESDIALKSKIDPKVF